MFVVEASTSQVHVRSSEGYPNHLHQECYDTCHSNLKAVSLILSFCGFRCSLLPSISGFGVIARPLLRSVLRIGVVASLLLPIDSVCLALEF